jgi:hypothetical protein
MRNGLQARQEQMRRRRLGYVDPGPVASPVDYSRRVVYGPNPGMTPVFPEYIPERRARVSGVYVLTESGRFYIGQSVDVFARLLSHLSKPACCGFTAPRGLLLASVPVRADWTWDKNAHSRLIAEARFLAAALSLDVPLTNKLTNYKRGKLLSLFPDLATEREIVERACGHE